MKRDWRLAAHPTRVVPSEGLAGNLGTHVGRFSDGMLPFRLIVVDENRSSTLLVVSLVRPPDRGDNIDLPHGGQCVVRQVLSSDGKDVAGVIVAGTA